jgi:hypothetical protein
LTKGKAGICSCCSSPHRREVDLALTARVPPSVIAKRFEVSIDSVKRHGRNHLTAVQAAALATAMRPSGVDLEELQEREGSSLLGQLVAQRAVLQSIGQSAFEAKQFQAAVSAERCVVANLDLVSRVLGLIVTKHATTSTHLLISPDYLELRSTLVEALVPYPEAARAVGVALHALESRAAEDITTKAAKANGKLIEHRPEVPS